MYARDGNGGTSLDAIDALRPMKREVIVLGVPSDAKSLQPRFFLYPATRGGPCKWHELRYQWTRGSM